MSDAPENDRAAPPPTAAAPPGTAMVRYEEENAMVEWDTAQKAIRLSVDDSTPAGRAAVSKMMLKADKKVDEVQSEILEVTDFLAHSIRVVSFQDGEIRDMMRLVLMLADGTTVGTTSTPFIKGFAYLASKLGRGPWSPPLLLEARVMPSGGGKRYFVCFEHVRKEDAAASKPGKAPGKPGKES